MYLDNLKEVYELNDWLFFLKLLLSNNNLCINFVCKCNNYYGTHVILIIIIKKMIVIFRKKKVNVVQKFYHRQIFVWNISKIVKLIV